MTKPFTKDTAFVDDWLAKLVADRGAIAALRRGLGKAPGTVHEMDRYILPFVSGEPDEPYYLLAALFAAWHQGKDVMVTCDGDFGQSLRAMVNLDQNREEAEKRLEKRFIALLNCHRDDLPQHLRQLSGLLKSKDVPVNWAQLLHDIRWWNREDREVQRSWARSFWSAARSTNEESHLEDIENPNQEGDEE